MSTSLQKHLGVIDSALSGFGVESYIAYKEINVIIKDQRDIHLVLAKLKTACAFEQRTDVTAVDYLTYGQSDW